MMSNVDVKGSGVVSYREPTEQFSRQVTKCSVQVQLFQRHIESSSCTFVKVHFREQLPKRTPLDPHSPEGSLLTISTSH